MPVASLTLASTDFCLRNSDEKIVVRGQLVQSSAEGCSWNYLTLQEMRGYRKNFLQARKLLNALFEQRVPAFGLKTMLAEQHLMSDDMKRPVTAITARHANRDRCAYHGRRND